MQTKYGFTKYTLQEFKDWLQTKRVARTVRFIQQHHTWLPNYQSFKGNNHFELQKGMKDHHIHNNGWSDIGQHFTTYPDGTIVTGRSLESSPACIYGNNAHSICIEHLGDFDLGKDTMTPEHKNTIIEMTAALCQRFSVPVTVQGIVYHHWFNLSTGERNNGSKNNKSCPGTNFFGGNKIQGCQDNFLPLVNGVLSGKQVITGSIQSKYVSVTASTLNIRSGPGKQFPKVEGRESARFGAVLRVFEEQHGWYKISNSHEHWVSKQWTSSIKIAKVISPSVNVYSGPGTGYPLAATALQDTDLFVYKNVEDWVKVGVDDRWVSEKSLEISTT